MKTLILLLFITPALHAQTIAEVRKIKTGKIITVNGHVTATFGDLCFIQDNTAAIAVYGAEVEENDSIAVMGKLAKFNSLLEIVVDSVRILGHKQPILPKTVSTLNYHEAELVRIENLRFPNNELFFYPQRAGIAIHNIDTVHYWIDENTDIPCILVDA